MKIIIFVIVVTTISSLFCYGQSTVPSATVKNLSGNQVNTNTFSNDGKPFVIDFWATWCKPCIEELKNIHEVYEDWQKETGVKLYAISIDDSRNSKKVAPFVNGRQWKFEVMLDENSDFKRAMNVNNPPHTFLYNGKGELVWQHNGYAQGDENNLYDEIKKLLAKENTGTENK
ncbi:MAG: TlpA family protein disulfide reductase [Ignavibacteriae bacterium]|nr:TlpA family protein disulfide reductase [Ignavibacteriota bacterium]